VVLKDLVSEDEYTLDVNRWLSRYEDDFDVCRELAISKPGLQPLPSKETIKDALFCIQDSEFHPQLNVHIANISTSR